MSKLDVLIVVMSAAALAALAGAGAMLYDPAGFSAYSPCEGSPCIASRTVAASFTIVSEPEYPDWIPPKGREALADAQHAWDERNNSGLLGQLFVLNGELEKMVPQRGVIDLFSDPAFLKAAAPLILAAYLAPLQMGLAMFVTLALLAEISYRPLNRLESVTVLGIVIRLSRRLAGLPAAFIVIALSMASAAWGGWLSWMGYHTALYSAAELLLYSAGALAIVWIALIAKYWNTCPTCGRDYH